MKRRALLSLTASAPLIATGCAAPSSTTSTSAAPAATLQGTGDLGVVIERAKGALTLINTSRREAVGRVTGLGDLSHASVVFSRDERFAYVFGRDGGLTQVDLLTQHITGRVMQAGNSIGGAISADGSLVVAQNYTPGGVKVFDAATLELLADLPAHTASGDARASSAWRPAAAPVHLQPIRRERHLHRRLLQPPKAAGHHHPQHRPPALRRAGLAQRTPLHRRPVR